jgi:lipopolysaccharide transport system permease protein
MRFSSALGPFKRPQTLQRRLIEPGGRGRQYWRDLWRYRDLFQVLAWRDVSVRYKQTVIGIAWALVRPFLAMVVFTIIFGKIAKLPSDGAEPYALMVLAGMLPWTFFGTAVTGAANSIVGNANLISKVYFPRLIVPVATVVVAFVDFLFGFIILLGLMIWFRFLPGWQFLMLPIFTALMLLVSLGPGLLLASLNVKYRDFGYVVPFVMQFGLYLSPVGFSSSVIPAQWRLVYSINPMVGVIDGFRWCILGRYSAPYLPGLWLGIGVAALALWIGVRKFRRTESRFADLI